MGDTVIRVNALGKMYRIGASRGGMEGAPGLRHTLEACMRQFGQRLRGRSIPVPIKEDFWALKDVSFEVKRGECLGVIGRNGAGKSTLLKVLSRITEPTTGEVGLRGRVGSLLEVGTGFHAELTGRENIFLNGAILGMGRKEIARKFEEIVAFSEVEKFLDTPVKYYSSGMYVRLAFAVAAHLEPEILIIDEVLAVGDAQFQQKCLGKMGEVTAGGRTVLFVSHQLATVRSLCTRCCVFSQGSLSFQGDVSDGINLYMRQASSESVRPARTFSRPDTEDPWIQSVALTSSGELATTIKLGDELVLTAEFRAPNGVRNPKLGFVISDDQGFPLLNANNRYQSTDDSYSVKTEGTIICSLGAVPLMPGRHHVSLWFGDSLHDTHHEEAAISFEVIDHDAWGLGRTPPKGVSALWWPTSFRIVDHSLVATCNQER